MERLDSYKVDLGGMPSDIVSYRWHVDDDFFSAVEGPEIQQGQLDVALRVKRTSGAYELTFNIEGTVKVTCDRCLELMDVPIDAEHCLRARLGEGYDDDGELVTVPESDGKLNVAWNIYEFAALEIPLRHVHPAGECEGQMAGKLDSLYASEEKADDEPVIDPRWNELRKILDNK